MRIRRTTIIIFTLICFAIPARAQNVTQDLLGRINGLRANLGLAPYSLNAALSAAANSHAQWMATTSQVSHIQDNGSTPQTRAQANGYNSQWVSENIYMGGLASIDTAWNFWINSAIHYAGLSSPNYQDIGIGTAQGEGGQAYVLVFGVPGGAAIANAGNASRSNGAAAPPIAIVGYDEVGNIQYELQAGDTLGQVLLLFGYTWDDLNSLLELNGLSEADITTLDIGQIILVPPPQGTYTPTPLAAEATQEITEEVSAELTQAVGELLPTSNLQPSGIIPTPFPETEAAPIEAIGEPATFVAVTASPTITMTASPIPTLQVNLPVSTAIPQAPTPVNDALVADTNTANQSNPPIWLIGAIVFQIGVLGFASLEYLRRSHR